MDEKLICQWLGLPGTTWPPDHYTLLGLRPDEASTARVEQRVQEQVARIRGYQIAHPEQATAAMNRLAQAFACLTDPQARLRYDAELGLVSPPAPSQAQADGQPAPVALAVLPVGLEDTAVSTRE